jgi:hypothetical protein
VTVALKVYSQLRRGSATTRPQKRRGSVPQSQRGHYQIGTGDEQGSTKTVGRHASSPTGTFSISKFELTFPERNFLENGRPLGWPL